MINFKAHFEKTDFVSWLIIVVCVLVVTLPILVPAYLVFKVNNTATRQEVKGLTEGLEETKESLDKANSKLRDIKAAIKDIKIPVKNGTVIDNVENLYDFEPVDKNREVQ